MDYKVGDIYKENGVYFIVTELINNVLSNSIPLSRWVLSRYIGSTEGALEIFEEMTFRFETNKLLKTI